MPLKSELNFVLVRYSNNLFLFRCVLDLPSARIDVLRLFQGMLSPASFAKRAVKNIPFSKENYTQWCL